MERMKRIKSVHIVYILMLCLAAMLTFLSHAAGEVVPITELRTRLESISDEEKKVLSELFTIDQEITALKADELKLSDEIEQLQKSIKQLESSIKEKQAAYDRQRGILKQVLVSHQRRGPASYLEILLKAQDLSSFIKSLNIIKDISRNTNELLNDLKEGQRELAEKKTSLEQENALLEQKRDELVQDLDKRLKLQQEKEEYLASLKQDSEYYSKQLELVAGMWDRCTRLMPELSREITDIISGGHFTLDDLNISFGFFNISGYITEDSFNRVLAEHSRLSSVNFSFEEGRVLIEVPEEKLLLIGNFEITGKSEISFVAEEGYFYDLPLEKSSIDEIFRNGSLIINFDQIAEDVIVIDFSIKDVSSQEGSLNFVIVPEF